MLFCNLFFVIRLPGNQVSDSHGDGRSQHDECLMSWGSMLNCAVIVRLLSGYCPVIVRLLSGYCAVYIGGSISRTKR